MSKIATIEFNNGVLSLIDQRKLPTEYEIFQCRDYRDVAFAIREMVVRGAPAIGATAAYGVAMAAMESLDLLDTAIQHLNEARPTAVNLVWATARMKKFAEKIMSEDHDDVAEALISEADRILKEDVETNKTMAKHGNTIIPKGATILTHCNTGALATAGYGTALGVVREAHFTGKDIYVYADETRPRLQGARLTAWELKEEEIPSTLIPDSVAATLIRDGKIDVILVGADRIALNGDSANKIGTFMLSVIAEKYNVPFYIVAPTTTIDFEIETGSEIEIEERSDEEVSHVRGVRIAPEGMNIYNPAFDVTPNDLITGIITEKGIVEAPYRENILKLR